MIVSELHEKLIAETVRLIDRLSLPLGPGALPPEHNHLRLVPALHAIVDRLDRLEASLVDQRLLIAGHVERTEERPEKHGAQQSGLTFEEFRGMFDQRLEKLEARIEPAGRDDHASTQNDDLPAPRGRRIVERLGED